MEEKENNPEVELEQENNEVEEDTTEQESSDDLQTELERANAEAAKWKAIANRNRKKSSQPLQTKKEPELGDDIVQTVKSLELSEKKRQFAFDHSLSPKETDFIFSLTQNKPTAKTLEQEDVKLWLEAKRNKSKLEANTPSSSRSSSFTFQGKEFNEMTDDERKKAFEERSKKFKK